MWFLLMYIYHNVISLNVIPKDVISQKVISLDMSFGFSGYQFFILWISVFLFYILRIPGYKFWILKRSVYEFWIPLLEMSLSVFTFPGYEFRVSLYYGFLKCEVDQDPISYNSNSKILYPKITEMNNENLFLLLKTSRKWLFIYCYK